MVAPCPQKGAFSLLPPNPLNDEHGNAHHIRMNTAKVEYLSAFLNVPSTQMCLPTWCQVLFQTILRGSGCPWYGPSVHPENHFATSALQCKIVPLGLVPGTTLWIYFWAFLGPSAIGEGRREAPGTVPLQNANGALRGSSASWVAKFKGDKNSEGKLSNGRL